MRQQLESSGTTGGCDRYDRCLRHDRNAGDGCYDTRSIRDRYCIAGWARRRRVLYAARRGSGEARNADLVARVHRAKRHGWTHHPVLVAVSHWETDSCVRRRARASHRHRRGTERHRLGPRHGRHG